MNEQDIANAVAVARGLDHARYEITLGKYRCYALLPENEEDCVGWPQYVLFFDGRYRMARDKEVERILDVLPE